MIIFCANYLYEACRRASLPVGVLPIEVSLVVQPEEAAPLGPAPGPFRVYEWKLSLLRSLARPYVAWKQLPRGL